MKKLFSLLFIVVPLILFSQVGIGTINPRGALDINNPTTNTHGLVLPTTNDPENSITNPQNGEGVVPGTVVYDSNLICIHF